MADIKQETHLMDSCFELGTGLKLWLGIPSQQNLGENFSFRFI